jgi:hypothetical protein
MKTHAIFIACVFTVALLMAAPNPARAAAPAVDFTRDVRPLLSNRCFRCHGFDPAERKSGLRLDERPAALAPLKSGKRALVPGDVAASELIRRVTTPDEEDRMPPAKSADRLKPAEIALLKRWVAEGAEYRALWSFIAPRSPPLPAAPKGAAVRNPIDLFVLEKLRAAKLDPSPEADRYTLIRRVSLDLTGLPPTPAEVDAFVADADPLAYENLVDRLLGSPAYGEHMAQPWLDAARYADTNGYNNDTPRSMWRWRDWVIRAFNANMPYDRFVTEQIAGDLLPDATLDQKIATGFNRNHVITSEGGIVDEEYRLEYVADRVYTTATTLLGLTLGCARCHDHKYDPITQRDYYSLSAFFNTIPDKGYDGHFGNSVPVIDIASPEHTQKLADARAKIADVKKKIAEHEAAAVAGAAQWQVAAPGAPAPPKPPTDVALHFTLDRPAAAGLLESVSGKSVGSIVGKTDFQPGRSGQALAFDGNTHADLGDLAALERSDKFTWSAWVFCKAGGALAVLSRMDDASAFRGYDLLIEDGRIAVHLVNHWPDNAVKVQTKAPAVPQNKWVHVAVTSDGSGKAAGMRLYADGNPQELEAIQDHLGDTIKTDKSFHIGRRQIGQPMIGLIDDVKLFARGLDPAEVAALVANSTLEQVLALAPAERSPEQNAQLRQAYLDQKDPAYAPLVKELAAATAAEAAVVKAAPTAMVMQEMPTPRDTFILKRGQYDQPGDKVEANVPASLPPLPKDAPHNRLGLARWLVDPANPLTARVEVNRLWQSHFGIGLVGTPADFGTQGEYPSHPALLDWLAAELIRRAWDVKATQRLIVTSATYRQSSRISPSLAESDPENRLLARGPRVRLSAEAVRDNALAIAGLLHHELGGPSVRPYQPVGLWEEVSVGDDSYSGGPYKQDHGPNLYRRGLYTWWKRTCPPPSLNTFDAPEREFCTVRRLPTNTPLQALVLMNDPTYVEAARVLAQRLLAEAGPATEARIVHAYRLALARPPKPPEIALLLAAYQARLARFTADPAAAEKLIAVGESPRPPNVNAPELAAWTAVAGMILNLDEAITRD